MDPAHGRGPGVREGAVSKGGTVARRLGGLKVTRPDPDVLRLRYTGGPCLVLSGLIGLLLSLIVAAVATRATRLTCLRDAEPGAIRCQIALTTLDLPLPFSAVTVELVPIDGEQILLQDVFPSQDEGAHPLEGMSEADVRRLEVFFDDSSQSEVVVHLWQGNRTALLGMAPTAVIGAWLVAAGLRYRASGWVFDRARRQIVHLWLMFPGLVIEPSEYPFDGAHVQIVSDSVGLWLSARGRWVHMTSGNLTLMKQLAHLLDEFMSDLTGARPNPSGLTARDL
jgi:hypothetical protein